MGAAQPAYVGKLVATFSHEPGCGSFLASVEHGCGGKPTTTKQIVPDWMTVSGHVGSGDPG
jgi:hypothetical protein